MPEPVKTPGYVGYAPCHVCGCVSPMPPKVVLETPEFALEGRSEAELKQLGDWRQRVPPDVLVCVCHTRILPGFLAMSLRERSLDNRLRRQMKAALTFRLFGHPFHPGASLADLQ